MFKSLWAVACLVAMSMVSNAQVVSSIPDDIPGSGRFVNITRGLSTLGADPAYVTIETTSSDLMLSVFDGDMGGKWDSINTSLVDVVRYSLYVDPLLTKSTDVLVGTWLSTSMVDNAWWTTIVPNSPTALLGNTYRYNLVVSWETTNTTNEQNNFKLRVNGEAYFVNSSIGFIGYTTNDPSPSIFPSLSYDGKWEFTYRVPSVERVLNSSSRTGCGDRNCDGNHRKWDCRGRNDRGSCRDRNHRDDCGDRDHRGDCGDPIVNTPSVVLSIWDGDFDRADDTNSLTSPLLPPWMASVYTLNQGVNVGAPLDDGWLLSPLTISPSIYWTVTDPWGGVTTNDNPSGNREWELTPINTPVAGDYLMTITGADGRNTLFLHPEVPMYCKTVVYNSCATRSWGFWKTHPDVVQLAMEKHINMGVLKGCPPVADQDLTLLNINSAESIFWAKLNDRSPLGKARLKLAYQLVAALCNNELFNSSPSDDTLLYRATLALNGRDIALMNTYASACEAYNLSGEEYSIEEEYNTKANPSLAESYAVVVNGKVYPGVGFE